MRLNPADREAGLTLLGSGGGVPGRERARRSEKAGGSQWVGVRADCGVVNAGRWAYCVWNESGGNLRVGWSCADATLKLGTDPWSFGYGGTATKSNASKFDKYGQTFGQGDAITCLLDLDRRAILYMKNGREIPGDAFVFGKDMVGWAIFPHLYTKEATFSVSFDGSGGAPPLTGGFQWIANAGRNLVPSPRHAPAGAGIEEEATASPSSGCGGSGEFVLTPYGWRTKAEAKKEWQTDSQEWRNALDAYVKHFTALLELEYEAERNAVAERVQKKSAAQLQSDGVGVVGLAAEFDQETGRITLWWPNGPMPFLQEISRGRTVLLSTVQGGVDVDDAMKTISAEVESINNEALVVVTQYERLPGPPVNARHHYTQQLYRADLGPNIIAYKRIDRMLDELQRCLGTSQAKSAKDKFQKLNCNQNLTGLLLPGAPLANALYSDIAESSASASKWDPMQRLKPNPAADVSKAAREKHIGAPPYAQKSPGTIRAGPSLNASQKESLRLVLEMRRRFSLIQGPPGTGKTTTAIAIVCNWIRSRQGPVLATAFSNRGTDNLADGLHKLGVRVLRMGLCSQDSPYSLETRLRECRAKRSEKGIQAVLQTVDVVCATCIGCAMGPLDKCTFPFIVVDEAAQVIEPAVTLPLGKGAVQAVMVGDQCQLPATVLSQEAQKRGLDVSMFDRLLSMGMEVQLLNQQYRMHPQIASFPSWRFYRGELRSGVTEAARQRPSRLPLKTPLAFLHVDAMEQNQGASKKNLAEAACVAWLVETVLRALPARLNGEEIGIITPYGAQANEIRRSLPHAVKEFIQVSTVDAFQGCEKDVIIVSLVRANAGGRVGFVDDWRRLNVAITRSKLLCVLVGNLPTWFASECALLRDWISFHTPASAEVHAFARGGLQPLPPALAEGMAALREEHARERPQASALPRVSGGASRAGTDAGRAKLRKLEAARALADALSRGDEEALKGALISASEAGVDEQRVREAEITLGRLKAERELADAAGAEDETTLTDALAKAKAAGVQQSTLKVAEQALQRVAAGRELGVALLKLQGESESGGSRVDEALVKKALARAKSAGANKDMIAEGERILKGSVASRALAEAVDAASLQKALAAAAEAGLQGDAVVEAEGALYRLSAAQALKDAIRNKNEAQLQKSLLEAKEAGVEEELVQEGWQTAQRLAAARELTSAINAAHDEASEGALSTALAAARQAGVPPATLAAAEKRLKRLRACRVIKSALARNDEEALRQAVAAGKAADMRADPVFVDAERRLESLAASRMLNSAIGKSDAAALEKALAAARKCRVDAKLIALGEAKLHEVAAAAIVQATESEDAQALRASVAVARTSGVDGYFIDAGEAKLKILSVAEELFAARELVVSLELVGSMHEDDVAALENLIGKAAEVGVDQPAIDEARTVLGRVRALGGGAEASGKEEPAAKRRRVQEAGNGSSTSTSARGEMADPLRAWSLCVLEAALLRCLKRQAAEIEDFDLALEAKTLEAGVARRASTARERCLGAAPAGSDADPAELESIRKRKIEAVANEDFDLAATLKKREAELLSSQQPAQVGSDAQAAEAALALLAGQAPSSALGSCDPQVARCVASAGPELWEAVRADLRFIIAGTE